MNKKNQSRTGKLERTLGLKEALSIGVGTMVGAGIFVFPGIAAGYAGPAAMLSFALGGLIAVTVASSTAELATAMPESGGGYFFVSRIFGPAAGFVVGVGQWIGLIFASAFYLTGFARYTIDLLEEAGYAMQDPAVLIACSVALLLTVVNILGTQSAGRLQNQVVIALTAILTLLLGYGVLDAVGVAGGSELPSPFAPNGYFPILTTTALIFTSYLGFVQIATVAGEIREPDKNLPRALIGSVLLVTVLYVSALFVSTSALPVSKLSELGETAMVDVARELLGKAGALGILAAGLLATLSSANASILSSSRAVHALSKDQMVPESISRINQRFGTPHIALLVVGVPIAAITLLGRIEILAEVASLLHLALYGMICVTLFQIRRDAPWWYRAGFRVPAAKTVSTAGAIFSFGLILFMEPLSILMGIGVLLISFIWYRRFITDIEFSLPSTVQMAYKMEKPKIIVATDLEEYNPLPKALLSAFSDLQLLVLGYRNVPDQTTPEQFRDEFEDESRENLNKVMDDLKEMDIEMESELIFSGDPAETFKSYIDDYESDAVLTSAPIESVERLLVPIYAKSQIRRKLASVLRELAISSELPISLIILTSSESGSEEEKEIEALEQSMLSELKRAGIPEDQIRSNKADVSSVAESVSQISSGDDVVVLGEPEGANHDSFFSSLHEDIEEKIHCPVLIVLHEKEAGEAS